jgi:hypothetical protein
VSTKNLFKKKRRREILRQMKKVRNGKLFKSQRREEKSAIMPLSLSPSEETSSSEETSFSEESSLVGLRTSPEKKEEEEGEDEDEEGKEYPVYYGVRRCLQNVVHSPRASPLLVG